MNVSVIIASYNYGKFISRAIDSVINQTYEDIEIIVIDDASTDDTSEIMRNQYPNIIYLQNPFNMGVSAARNRGLDIASGDIITFLDADDWLQPNAIERQLPFFEDGSVGVVYPLGVKFDNKTGKVITRWDPKSVHSGVVTDKLFVHMFMHIGALIRRSVIGNVRFIDSMKLSEDWWFFMELSFKCEFRAVYEYLYMYSTHDKQATSEDVLAGLDTDTQARVDFLKIYSNRISQDALRDFTFNMYLERGYWYRNVSKWKSIVSYLKALNMKPLKANSYTGIVKTLISIFMTIPNLNTWRANENT